MKRFEIVKNCLNIIILFLIGVSGIVFSILYVNTFNCGFFCNNKKIIVSGITVSVSIITVISLIYSFSKNKFIYRLTIVVLSIFATLISTLYILKITGVLDKIDSVESLRSYVASFGYLAVVVYILLNVLQVVALPLPGFITLGTGVALFGALKTAIYSFIGISLGSLIAFFIGRCLGYKVVAWLVGKDALDKAIKSIKNKDKVVLTFMFLFPFFPDDILCFVAGLSSMSTSYFIVMILVCRLISVFSTAYSLNGSIIPYNTWWGIVLWIVLFAVVVSMSMLIYKKGDKIEKFFKKFFKKRKSNENNSSR